MDNPQTTSPAKEISCEQCREFLSDYIDRELSQDEKNSVERHLNTCVKCGSESTRLHGLKKMMQHWDGVKGSGEFRKSVMDRMIRESQQMPSGEFVDAAARAKAAEEPLPDPDDRRLPPIWILLVFGVLAVIAYFVVLKLRGQ